MIFIVSNGHAKTVIAKQLLGRWLWHK